MRRELHREMRTLSIHYRSLIAEERTGRRKRGEGREAGRILQLKEDWERKLSAAVRQRMLDTEAKLVAVALLSVVPDGKPSRVATRAKAAASPAKSWARRARLTGLSGMRRIVGSPRQEGSLSTHLVKHTKITKRQMKEDPLVTAFRATAQWERHGSRDPWGSACSPPPRALGFLHDAG
jgi:hypothetical protein